LEQKQDKKEFHDAEFCNVLGAIQQFMCMLYLEENEESPETEEEADPAEELDESVRIVNGWMMILHPT